MTGLYDTHVHFHASKTSAVEMVDRATEAGVSKIMAVGGSDALNLAAAQAARLRPGVVRLALGWDRDQISDGEHSRSSLDEAVSRAGARDLTLAAVGETGLDYAVSEQPREVQRHRFAAQVREAADLALPIVVHCREAQNDTLAILREALPGRPASEGRAGVLHCFTGDWPFARALLDLGFYISFSGIVTFRNAAALREIAVKIPGDRLLIETDTPFLTPAPHRGRPNEPLFVGEIARLLAGLCSRDEQEIADSTARNAVRLFGA